MHTITLERGRTSTRRRVRSPTTTFSTAPRVSWSVLRMAPNTSFSARSCVTLFCLCLVAQPSYTQKDAAMIVGLADIYPGARVIEAGAGSGAMTCSLLRAVGDSGYVHSQRAPEDFAEIAAANVEKYFGREHPAWEITVGDLAESLTDTNVDRAVLDMLAPWECVEAVHRALRPGGVLCVYVATTTQMSRTVEGSQVDGRLDRPESIETLLRSWHVEGLAVRPNHRNGRTHWFSSLRAAWQMAWNCHPRGLGHQRAPTAMTGRPSSTRTNEGHARVRSLHSARNREMLTGFCAWTSTGGLSWRLTKATTGTAEGLSDH